MAAWVGGGGGRGGGGGVVWYKQNEAAMIRTIYKANANLTPEVQFEIHRQHAGIPLLQGGGGGFLAGADGFSHHLGHLSHFPIWFKL